MYFGEMEFLWIHQMTSMVQLFMEANMHEAVFPYSFYFRRQDEMGLACEKQDSRKHHQHGRRKPL